MRFAEEYLREDGSRFDVIVAEVANYWRDREQRTPQGDAPRTALR
jgi:hypothetical protein